MSQGFWTQTNHHWFATLFSMMAVYLSIGAVQSAEPEGGVPSGVPSLRAWHAEPQVCRPSTVAR
jgi:hypothetical protein